MPDPNTLKVYPNPWHAFDKEGRPCAVVPRDPESDGGGPGDYVGAHVDRKHTQVLQKLDKADRLRSAMQRTVYAYLGISASDPLLAAKLFASEPVSVPRSRYYRQRISDGSLLCADIETARAAKFTGFVPVADLAKRYAPLVGLEASANGTTTEATLEAGAPPLSAGESLGDLQSAPDAKPVPKKRSSESQ